MGKFNGAAYHGMNDEINAKDMFRKLDELAGPNTIDRISNEFGTWGKLRIVFDETLPFINNMGSINILLKIKFFAFFCYWVISCF